MRSRQHKINPEHPDPTGGRLFPIPDVTVDALSLIPLGSEVVIVNSSDDSVQAGDWLPETRDDLLAKAAALTEEARTYLMVFYLPPLVSVQYAVTKVLSDHGLNLPDGLFHAVKSGTLTAEEFTAILNDVASEAQKEVTPS